MDAKLLAATRRVMRKLYKIDRPSCLVYMRADRFLVRATALFGHLAKAGAGPVRVLPHDADPRQIGEAVLGALAAYELHPDAPPSPPKDNLRPLLKAAGVKSVKGLDHAAAVSVERVGKRVAVVPLVWQDGGGHARADTGETLCAARPDSLGEVVRRLLVEQANVDRYHRAEYGKHRPETEAERRAVAGVTTPGRPASGTTAAAGRRARGARTSAGRRTPKSM
jgi:hypothetical protein